MQRFLLSSLIVAYLFVLTLPALAESSPPLVSPDAAHYRVFDGEGRPATIDQIVEHCKNINVVFWGEEHNDAVGHALQALFFQRLISRYSATRPGALSLEMFERDTQVVLDEYLSGLITESQFLSSSRPWANYSQDYKPLVLLAKEHHVPVIAANAPRRYVNLVSRRGRAALNLLSPQAKSWLAPLPYPAASAAYARRFAALMSGTTSAGTQTSAGTHGHSRNLVHSNLIDSQALWDATMADSLTRFLKGKKRPLILHLSGKFHSEYKLGTVEQLLISSPQAKACVVTVVSSLSSPAFEPQTHRKLGDFVILTAPKLKTS